VPIGACDGPTIRRSSLSFSYDTDPQLQCVFGFTVPLESPGSLEAPLPDTTPAAASTVTPAAPLISPSPTASPVPSRSSPALAGCGKTMSFPPSTTI